MLFSVGDDAAFFSSGAEEKNAADDTKQVLGRVVVARKADAPAAGASNHPKKRPNTALVVVIAETTLLLPASLHEEKNIRLILEDCRPMMLDARSWILRWCDLFFPVAPEARNPRREVHDSREGSTLLQGLSPTAIHPTMNNASASRTAGREY